MQRSDLALGVLGFAAAGGAWLLAGELGAFVVGAALGCGVLAGLLLSWRPSPRRARRARVRKVARAAPVMHRRPSNPAAQHRSMLAVRGALPVEPAAARAETSLRLTGDILRGMKTGGKVTRGLCSRCGATLWLSAQRPVRARCPVCGTTRLLTA